MWGGAGRHLAVAGELTEWWEDLWQRGIGSHVVLLEVPDGWGQAMVLDHLAAVAGGDSGPVTLVVQVDGRALPDEPGLQAAVLRDCLAEAGARHRVSELLGLDRADGVVQAGLGVGGLFVSGLAGALAFLLAGVAVGAAGKAWDDSPAGQDGALARAGRAVAAVSVSVPVVVIIDDAACLDKDLMITLVDSLVSRHDGQVLVVAAAALGSGLPQALTSRSWYGLIAGRVQRADADPDMGFTPRLALAADRLPGLPGAAARRIAQRTRTFAEILAVTAAGRMAELTEADDEAGVLAAVDAVISARLDRAAPSAEAVVLAWAGGLAHVRQAAAALDILGVDRVTGEGDVTRLGPVIRLADPADPRLAGQIEALPARTRQALAAAFLDQAAQVAAGPGAGLVDRAVAGLAVHRVRSWLAGPDRDRLPRVQARLVTALEELGDYAAARETAGAALAEWRPGLQHQQERDQLSAAALRLARAAGEPARDPLTRKLIDAALADGAATGLEARTWAAITLLGEPGRREIALVLTDQVAADLDSRPNLGSAGDRWRLLLAFHAGQAGYPAITHRLLAPLLTSASPRDQDAASAVLRAVGGPGAGTRLQVIILEAELDATPGDVDDDRLRLHHALAADYGALGDYRRALDHARAELTLRHRTQPPGHPATLTTRAYISGWTGQSGDAASALHLAQELLPELECVSGPDHPDSLTTRSNIAYWTGESGDAATALHLSLALLPALERVLGPDHHHALTVRSNIAKWTGDSGDAAAALRIQEQLLPDMERVSGPGHPDTLAIRSSIARWTGDSGDAATALRLYQALAPDLERVLGPGHPHILTTRNNIAYWAGRSGDAPTALRLYHELLPDLERVLGPGHPDTLATRGNIAGWTAESGDAATALDLFQKLLPDLNRVRGPGHPDTLATLASIAYWERHADIG
jgi:tetratricopeptide (TPR) repeat protein